MCVLDRSHKSLSIRVLGHRLGSMPMFLALIPFALGILLEEHVLLPTSLVAGATLLTATVAVFAMPRNVASCYVAVTLLFVGYLLSELRDMGVTVPYDQDVEMVVAVEGIPSERGDYSVADGRIERWCDGEGWHDVDYRVVVWLRADSIVMGDRLTVCGRLNERMSRHESYDDLMHRRGFVGGVGVNSYNIISKEHAEPTDMQYRAIKRLDAYARDSVSRATVVAMAVGARYNIPAQLREAYSTTGMAHLLAVSGLHLGIVLMVVGVLLIPLRFIHRGHRLSAMLSVVAIWLYALMSGSSPSVLRAAIMLTVLQLARASSARYNSVNILAATAFVMLVVRPDYLYDVSFQLSVAAVFGIVAWGGPLMRAVRTLPWVVSTLLSLFIVGAVATLWTMPIISHTFGNIPLVGVLLTPCVLLFSNIVVGGGILAVIMPTAIAVPFAWAAEWAAGVQNRVVVWAADLPLASVNYAMSEHEVMLCYLIYIVITLLYWSKNQKKVVTLPHYD